MIRRMAEVALVAQAEKYRLLGQKFQILRVRNAAGL